MSVSGEDMAKFMMAHLNDGNYQHSKDAEIFSVRSAGGFHTHLRGRAKITSHFMG
jgi:hypothetical protein